MIAMLGRILVVHRVLTDYVLPIYELVRGNTIRVEVSPINSVKRYAHCLVEYKKLHFSHETQVSGDSYLDILVRGWWRGLCCFFHKRTNELLRPALLWIGYIRRANPSRCTHFWNHLNRIDLRLLRLYSHQYHAGTDDQYKG